MTKKIFYTFALLFTLVLVSAQSCRQSAGTDDSAASIQEEAADNNVGAAIDDEKKEEDSTVGDEAAENEDGIIEENSTDSAIVEKDGEGEAMAQGEVKTFTIEGGKFYFSVDTITVNKGDTVKIVFSNVDGFHDWVVDEFNARTKQINMGETDTVEFVADQAGEFEYYCSVGNHRELGMVGRLIVNEQ